MPLSTEVLYEMKWKAIRIKPYLEGKDAKWTARAIEEYEALVDRFFNENQGMMTPIQYEAAKQDFEYFMSMLILAEAYNKEGDTD
ncbi:MAG: hypothetical protein CSYNP_01611 [Syntrophus sp. SKADARSKE-3]|nr:hypothetical protein [Syntrophus sp. SKADARSKE-3]